MEEWYQIHIHTLNGFRNGRPNIFFLKKKRQSKEKRNYVRNGIIFLETNQGSKDNTYIAYCGKSDKNESPATE